MVRANKLTDVVLPKINASVTPQHVPEPDTLIGLRPTTPNKGTTDNRVVPIIMEQRVGGHVTVRMPNTVHGVNWSTDGVLTGRRGMMENLQQVVLSNGDTISALPMGAPPPYQW